MSTLTVSNRAAPSGTQVCASISSHTDATGQCSNDPANCLAYAKSRSAGSLHALLAHSWICSCRRARAWKVFSRKIIAYVAANFLNSLLSQGNGVGTHIGNQTYGLTADIDAFIQRLGSSHGAISSHSELTHAFLLQGGSRKWGSRVPLLGALFDPYHFRWQFGIDQG